MSSFHCKRKESYAILPFQLGLIENELIKFPIWYTSKAFRLIAVVYSSMIWKSSAINCKSFYCFSSATLSKESIRLQKSSELTAEQLKLRSASVWCFDKNYLIVRQSMSVGSNFRFFVATRRQQAWLRFWLNVLENANSQRWLDNNKSKHFLLAH